jgi:medium-chain acyl-[acyl-carrier-protein] hydrolase
LESGQIGLFHYPDQIFMRCPLVIFEMNSILTCYELWEAHPEDVLASKELMELLLPTIRADFELCEGYRNIERRPLEFPVAAFGGIDDVSVDEEALQAWSKYTTCKFECYMFQGRAFLFRRDM